MTHWWDSTHKVDKN